jgi:hypothetical protein
LAVAQYLCCTDDPHAAVFTEEVDDEAFYKLNTVKKKEHMASVKCKLGNGTVGLPKGNSLQQHKGRTTMSLPHRNHLRLLPLRKWQMVLADRLTETSLTWINLFPNRFSY